MRTFGLIVAVVGAITLLYGWLSSNSALGMPSINFDIAFSRIVNVIAGGFFVLIGLYLRQIGKPQ